jgi:Flp pilus assembly pilin Flp
MRGPAGRTGRAGQGLVEYGLILALTSVFTAIILGVFGGTLADILGLIGNAIDAATGG